MTPEQIEQMKAALEGATAGKWFGANMTHAEGRPMTPEEIGEYVCSSVKMGTPDRFLFVGVEGADIAHFGNGPCGNANATLTVLSKQMAAHIIAQSEQIDALEKRVEAALERLDASLFTYAEHHQAIAILRATGGQNNE